MPILPENFGVSTVRIDVPAALTRYSVSEQSFSVHALTRDIEEPVHTFAYAQRVLHLAFDRLGFALSSERSDIFEVRYPHSRVRIRQRGVNPQPECPLSGLGVAILSEPFGHHNYCAQEHRLPLKVSAISFWMIPPVDIFRVVERGQHLWIEPSETVKEALMRVQSLGMGEYLITNQRTGFRLSLTVDVSAIEASS